MSVVVDPAKKLRRRRTNQIALLVIVGVIVLAIVGIVVGSVKATPKIDPLVGQAEVQCENLVKAQLKAPSTAKFSNETANPDGTNKWAAAGDVDAQNSFGAAIRNTFQCNLNYAPSTQDWTGTATLSQ